jgi:hypothetical protein
MAFLLFLLFQSLYALTSSGNAFRVPDEFEVYFQVEHFVDEGDLSVPQTLAIRQPTIVDGRVVDAQPIFYGRLGRDGKPYAPYGPFAALLALPHHLFARLVALAAGVPREPLPGGIVWVFLVGGLTMLSSATGAALAVAGFYRAAILLEATPATASILALLLGGATVLWPYGTSFYSEGWQAALLIWTAALLLDARSGGRRAVLEVGAAASLLTIVILTKVTSILFAVWFLPAVMLDRVAPDRERARTAAALAAGLAIAVALHLAWNMHRFGDPFDFGYDAAETIPQMPPQTIRLADVPRGLVLLLATPGKSLFLWAPVLLLACASLSDFWRREPGIAAAIGAAAATGLGFYAAYLFPEAGYSHGPRQLVPLVPLLLLPAAAVPIGARSRAAVIACAVVGFTIALMAASISFLQDQGLGQDLGAGAQVAYYERIDPPPGRPWNRYRLAYVPFVRTLTSGQWPRGDSLGHGLDFFPHHLARARQQLRNGASIPAWLIWLLTLAWLALLTFAAIGIRRIASVL